MKERKPKKPPGSASLRGPLSRVGSFLDTAIFNVAPRFGEKRKAARLRSALVEEQISNYKKLSHFAGAASNTSRDHRFIGSKHSTDSQIEDDLEELQYRSRELYQSNPTAHAAIESRVTHEVGVGLACRPRIREGDGVTKEQAEELNQRLKDVCERWSTRGVDRRRRLSLGMLQRLADRTFATYGEAFALFRYAPSRGPLMLAVDIIDPRRVETPPEKRRDPNCRLGIQYDGDDQIQGYWIRSTLPGDGRFGRHSFRYDFISRYDEGGNEQMVHLFDSLLPEQTRGLPWLLTAISRIKDLDDFFEAELIAKQIEACFSLIFKSGSNGASPHDLAEGNAVDTNAAGQRVEEIYPGMVHYMGEDDTVEKIDPVRPGANFAPFVEMALRSIAASTNFPYELLAKNFFRTTYSSGRLSMLDGRLGFKMRQSIFTEMLLEPLWRRVVNDAFMTGQLEGLATSTQYVLTPYIFERHRWGGQAYGAVDPEKEVKAHSLALESGQETLSEVFAERNLDWSDALDQRHEERRREVEHQIQLEKYEMELREQEGLPIPGEEEDPTESPQEGEDE